MTTSETDEKTWYYAIQWKSTPDRELRATALARRYDGDFSDVRAELYDPATDTWVPDLSETGDLWTQLKDHDWGSSRPAAMVPEIIEQLKADHAAEVAARPEHWLAQMRTGGKVLLRSYDRGATVEGYFISGQVWGAIPDEGRAPISDPGTWQPVAWDDLETIEAQLVEEWGQRLDHLQAENYEKFVVKDLTEATAKKAVEHYIVETLKALPEGISLDMDPPGGPRGGVGPGRPGPRGSESFEAHYSVRGFPDGYQDKVLDAFHQAWERFGWLRKDYESEQVGQRLIYAQAPGGYDVELALHRSHGKVFTTWASPSYPAETADPHAPIATLITKDGPQSYADPYARDYEE